MRILGAGENTGRSGKQAVKQVTENIMKAPDSTEQIFYNKGWQNMKNYLTLPV